MDTVAASKNYNVAGTCVGCALVPCVSLCEAIILRFPLCQKFLMLQVTVSPITNVWSYMLAEGAFNQATRLVKGKLTGQQ